MWTTALSDHPLPVLPWSVAVGGALLGAITDARSRRIPNLLTGPLLLLGLACSFAWLGGPGLLDSLVGALVLGAPFVLLFVFAGGGAGDAKLMAALGSWLGLGQGLVALASVCLVGLLLGLLFARRSGRLGTVLGRVRGILIGAFASVATLGSWRAARAYFPPGDEGEEKLPYGLAIFGGVLVAALATWARAAW